MNNGTFKKENGEVFNADVPFSIYELEKIISGDSLDFNFRKENGSHYKVEEILDK